MSSNLLFIDHCIDGDGESLPRLFEAYSGTIVKSLRCICKSQGKCNKKENEFIESGDLNQSGFVNVCRSGSKSNESEMIQNRFHDILCKIYNCKPPLPHMSCIQKLHFDPLLLQDNNSYPLLSYITSRDIALQVYNREEVVDFLKVPYPDKDLWYIIPFFLGDMELIPLTERLGLSNEGHEASSEKTPANVITSQNSHPLAEPQEYYSSEKNQNDEQQNVHEQEQEEVIPQVLG